MSENFEKSWDSLKPLKGTWSLAEAKAEAEFRKNAREEFVRLANGDYDYTPMPLSGLKPNAPTLGQDQIPVVQSGQPKLINTWRGKCVTMEAVVDGEVLVSKVDDPTNFDLDCVTLPENIVDMIPQHDGTLVFGELGGLWLVDDNGATRAVPEEENLWRMANSRMERVPQSLMPAEDDPQPDHIIKAE